MAAKQIAILFGIICFRVREERKDSERKNEDQVLNPITMTVVRLKPNGEFTLTKI